MTAPSHSRNVNGVRYYTDPTTGRTDLISVTSALDNVGSPDALIGWAIRLTADQAFDIDYANADALKRATHVEKNRAADRGTRVHEMLEETVKVGHRPNLAITDPEAWPYIQAGWRFLDEWAPQIHHCELQVFTANWRWHWKSKA